MQTVYEAATFSVFLLLAQAATGASQVSTWVDMASLPFAFAVGSFLIWSIVQLLNAVLKGKDSATEATIAALREQVNALRKFQDERLTQLIDRDAMALEKTSEASMASTKAWGEVHEDFRELITELKIRPCIAKRDQLGV
jgi:hypothetical protein